MVLFVDLGGFVEAVGLMSNFIEDVGLMQILIELLAQYKFS